VVTGLAHDLLAEGRRPARVEGAVADGGKPLGVVHRGGADGEPSGNAGAGIAASRLRSVRWSNSRYRRNPSRVNCAARTSSHPNTSVTTQASPPSACAMWRSVVW
jgi:hypothetical protein